MIHKLFLTVVLPLFISNSFANNNPDWGDTGHRTIGLIAESHLSKKAKKQINKILKGRSLDFVSTYGDEIKSDDDYDKYYNWHFVNFPFDTKYENSEKSAKGDIVSGIEKCIAILKDPNASLKDREFYLKFLVHLIGDLHQPLHVGRSEDKGGNDIKLTWHYKKSNLHRVWDSEMIRSWNMSYTELANNAKTLSKEQITAIEKGSVLDWTYESQALAKKIYSVAKKDDKLGYRYSYDNFGIVQSQLQKSGIRLAKILNEIYG